MIVPDPLNTQDNRNQWKKAFRAFYDDNSLGGKSRWHVSPSTVETFISGLLESKRISVSFTSNCCICGTADKITDETRTCCCAKTQTKIDCHCCC